MKSKLYKRLTMVFTAILMFSYIATSQDTITVQVSTSSDDAEEGGLNGAVTTSSSDLELGEYDTWTQDGVEQGIQTIGLRFNNITIPPYSTILSTSIQFQCDQTGDTLVQLTIYGENTANAETFKDANFDTLDHFYNITNRPRTIEYVVWDVPEWDFAGDAGLAQQTADLAPIVQAIVNREDWASGNSMVFIMEPSGPSLGVTFNTGGREAEAFDGTGAPILNVTYAPTTTISIPIAAGADDAEETLHRAVKGQVDLSSADLELGHDGGYAQAVGLRYVLPVGQGAIISEAYLQFSADQPSADTLTLKIYAEADDDAAPFTTDSANITMRAKTTAQVMWTPFDWETKHAAADSQRTVDISSLIQEVVSREGWVYRNAIVFVLTPTNPPIIPESSVADTMGYRESGSYEDIDDPAPVLHLTYVGGALSANASFDSTNITCFGLADGETTVAVTGGTPPYTYQWDDDLSTSSATVTGLSANKYYHVIVTDADLYSVTDSVKLSQPDLLTAMITDSTHITGPGLSDGTATVKPVGGTPPYSYLWDDDLSSTNSNVTGLSANKWYHVIVSDAHSCTAIDSVILATISQTRITIQITDPRDDAEEYASAVGGEVIGQVWNTSSDLELVFDSEVQHVGMIFRAVAIPAGSIITNAYVQFQVDAVMAGVTDAALTLEIYGAKEATIPAGAFDEAVPFCISSHPPTTAKVSWSPGPSVAEGDRGANERTADIKSIIQEIIGLAGWASGNNIMIVIKWTGDVDQNVNINREMEAADGDLLGAPTLNVLYKVDEPVTDIMDSTNITCFGLADGEATVTATGGTPPYTYEWDDDLNTTSATVAGLYANKYYHVIVTDANLYSATDSVKLSEPNLLTAAITDSTNISGVGLSDGTASVTPGGGTPPYTYLWDDDLSATDSTVTGLSSNIWYHVIVTDAHSCTTMDSVKLSEASPLYAEITKRTNVSCKGLSDGSAIVANWGGTPPYSIVWNDDAGSTIPAVTNLSPERWYRVNVTDAGMQTVKDSVYISEPDSITIESVIPGVLCPGKSNGSISINASGGTSPYEYLWSNDATTSSITNIPAGKYWVRVTDFNSCSKTDTIILNSIPFSPEAKICIVSLDTITRKNLVIWEREIGKGIKSYKIYRQGVYDTLLIGTVPFDSLSVLLDENSEPEKYSHKYWIKTVDSCGNESGYSPYHQAMRLTTLVGTDRINLLWTAYEAEGIDGLVKGYWILRSFTYMNYQVLSRVSDGTYSYPDMEPPDGSNYYIVAAELVEPCEPTGGKLKAGTGPYVHSLSNMDENKLHEEIPDGIGYLLSSDGFLIYPNPVTDRATIVFANPDRKEYQLVLTDLTGKVLKLIDNITEDKVEIDRNGLSDGLYLIELRGPKIYRGKIVIE